MLINIFPINFTKLVQVQQSTSWSRYHKYRNITNWWRNPTVVVAYYVKTNELKCIYIYMYQNSSIRKYNQSALHIWTVITRSTNHKRLSKNFNITLLLLYFCMYEILIDTQTTQAQNLNKPDTRNWYLCRRIVDRPKIYNYAIYFL